MIVFRVDTRCGLGHLMRMKWLALACSEQGQQCHFLLEQTGLAADFFQNFPAQIHWLPAGLTETEDAVWCLEKLSALNAAAGNETAVQWVIVDGYGFGLCWETTIKQAGYALVAIDDLERSHQADVIVDAKWQGCRTLQRYMPASEGQTQPIRLLGPDFAILAPEYSSGKDVVRSRQLMFALGGGGDWQQLTAVIALLLTDAALESWTLLVIIGPYAVNTAELEQLSLRYPQLQLVRAPASLAAYYRSSQLFVGALGTSLYELAATKTPALTFALADNQQNQLQDLADLGHFLHLDSLIAIPAAALAQLVLVCVQNIERVKALRQSGKLEVDGLGARRIADFLLTRQEPAPAPASVERAENTATAEKIFLTPALSLRAVADTDINAYLTARNRPDNSWRMTITHSIPRHEHYCWWFSQQGSQQSSQQRQSFVLEQNGQALLYVWQQLRSFQGQNYWIGGWFAASDQVNFSHAQLILDWQLQCSAKQQPDAIWVAVIHQENKFVQLLNQRAGFVRLEPESLQCQATQHFFPQADHTLFHFVGKWPHQES